MIITKIKGGLGNQMFEYACGRALAEANNCALKLDLGWFEQGASYNHDIFFLDRFDMDIDMATESDLASVLPLGQLGKKAVSSLYSVHPPLCQRFCNYYRERQRTEISDSGHGPFILSFSPHVAALDPPCYLDGYWQSERYFDDITDIIRDAFTLSNQMTGANAETMRKIRDSNSVSVHLRRGDYVNHGNALNMAYYRRAIERVQSAVDRPSFFVFSDDISWAREHFKFDEATHFVSQNGIDRCELDVALMARCDHNIIANSTFSWWGAWLNPNDDKLVISPAIWTSGRPVDALDIIPDRWETVSW